VSSDAPDPPQGVLRVGFEIEPTGPASFLQLERVSDPRREPLSRPLNEIGYTAPKVIGR
jgi:hypothetical protein